MAPRLTDNPNYLTIHKRIWRRRGKASQYGCVDCGDGAQEWSYIHDTDPVDVNNYEPRCRSCHYWYDDKVSSRTPEVARKISDALKGKKLSAEHRRAISESHKGYKPTEEQKAKISAAMKGKPKSPEHQAKLRSRNRDKNGKFK